MVSINRGSVNLPGPSSARPGLKKRVLFKLLDYSILLGFLEVRIWHITSGCIVWRKR